jgi:hypothetical protein
MIHPQWHLVMKLPTAEREEDNLAVSPMSKIVKKILVQKKTLHESQIPSFISRLTDAIQEPIPFVANPIQVTKKRGRPRGALNKISRKRDKSAFEYVEGRKCGKCGNSGHNARTCQESG